MNMAGVARDRLSMSRTVPNGISLGQEYIATVDGIAIADNHAYEEDCLGTL